MTRRFTTSVSMMWRDLPVVERFTQAKAAGFVGAEIQFVGEVPIAEWWAASQASGLPIVLINLDLGDFLGGGPGLSGVPGREDQFRDAAGRARDAADRLAPEFVHIGPSRIPESASRDQCLETFAANLDYLAALFSDSAASLVIEPTNRAQAPTILIASADEASTVISSGHLAYGIQHDIFHAVIDGRDPVADFRAHRDLIRHVQFSDVPMRGAPGTGSIDFAAIFVGLEREGYAGAYGAEYMSFTDTRATLGWMDALR